MIIQLTTGIDKCVFGMTSKDTFSLYGKADKEFKDEEGNVIHQYNNLKTKITFYADENYRLGYLSCSHPDLTLWNEKIIGQKIDDFLKLAEKHKIIKWEKEDFDTFDNYFNEDHWINLHVEYDEIIRVEIGALIVNDEFVWRTK